MRRLREAEAGHRDDQRTACKATKITVTVTGLREEIKNASVEIEDIPSCPSPSASP